MPRVMFTISYSIRPDQRSTYLSLIGELKTKMTSVGRNYSVFETKGKKNSFNEVYVLTSEEEYDALDENQDEFTQDLLGKLEACVDDKGMKYTTAVEAA
jgi:hypothetical protein